MKNIFLYPLLIVLVAGCDRLAKDNSAKIQIQLPTAASVSSKIETYGYGTQPIPDGLSGVAGVNTPINCYIIAYSGPEAELIRNTCTRDDGSKKFNIGQWAGGITPGETVALDVPSGKNRTFYVIGVHAAPGYCKDFKAGFPEDDLLSKPYILGKVEGVTLNAGETKELPIPVAFSTTEYFDDCVGPDFPSKNGGGNGGTITPTAIKLSKDYFPYGNFTQYTCQSVDVSLVDSMGRTGSLPHSVSFSVINLAGSFQAYATMADCGAGTPSLTQVTIPANTYHTNFVVKPSTGSSISFEAASISSATALSSLPLTAPVIYSNDPTFEVDAPHSILPGSCYRVQMNNKLANNSFNPPSVNTNVTVTSSGVSLFSDASCATQITAFDFTMGVDRRVFYIQAPSSNSTNSVSITLSSSGYVTATRKIWLGSGNLTPYALQIDGPNQMGSGSAVCYSNSPYRVRLVNSHFTAIPAPAAISFSLATSSASLSTYSASDCNGGSALTTGSLPANEHTSDVYLYNLGITGPQSITVTPSGGLQGSSYNIMINP